MPTVFDVAQYLLNKMGPMTTIKLQKLVYYCQAWSLVWDDAPLFENNIQAWANGPVSPDLFTCFKGDYYALPAANIGRDDVFSDVQKETIDVIIRDYGNRDAHWLIELSHSEPPWRNARTRAGVRPGEKCNETITFADMAEYYSGLVD